MKTLYLSDLDGTLLNQNAELSENTIQLLNALIKQGIHFTIATARTAATVIKILESLELNVPVILMNGVLLYDVQAKKYLSTHYLSKDSTAAIIQTLKDENLTGFLYEVKNNTLSTYYERLSSKHMQDFYEERVTRYNKKFTQINDFAHIDHSHMVYFSIQDSKANLDPVYEKLKTDPELALAFYKDIYINEEDIWYLEIFSHKATKYNAAKALCERGNYDYMVGFGDNLNDIPLFQACDETCAVENAKDELKSIATHLIGSNQKDGVARWLAERELSKTAIYATVIGPIGIREKGGCITDIFFYDSSLTVDEIEHSLADSILEETPLLKEAATQINQYLAGLRTTFDLPLSLRGTEFQKKVWRALQDIPYGETRSYKEIAEAVGNPKASRAVGMANNKNPLSILIPCHRVIGANGKLVGYGGGLDKKEYLLGMERKASLNSSGKNDSLNDTKNHCLNDSGKSDGLSGSGKNNNLTCTGKNNLTCTGKTNCSITKINNNSNTCSNNSSASMNED